VHTGLPGRTEIPAAGAAITLTRLPGMKALRAAFSRCRRVRGRGVEALRRANRLPKILLAYYSIL
jgi:hypothetical protein